MFNQGFQTPQNNKSTRPAASYFHLFLGVWNTWWNTRTRFWYITSQTLQVKTQKITTMKVLIPSLNLQRFWWFYHSIYPWAFALIERTYQMLEIVFHQLCKHLKFCQKYSAECGIFNSLLCVWMSPWNTLSCLIYYLKGILFTETSLPWKTNNIIDNKFLNAVKCNLTKLTTKRSWYLSIGQRSAVSRAGSGPPSVVACFSVAYWSGFCSWARSYPADTDLSGGPQTSRAPIFHTAWCSS